MSYTLTPNMSLPVPVVGNEPGPQFATDVNNSLTILDAHTHAAGSGVQITPSGLNINSSLSMQNNPLAAVQAIAYQVQSSDPSPNYSSYTKGVDFYLKDGSGNVIRLTQSGAVAGSSGTITGLPSGTASASYVSGSGTFVFQSATSTAANIDGGSYVFRNSGAGSNGLTLQPPLALGSNYSVTLPQPNGLSVTGVMTLDTSNNMGAITYDQVGVNMTSTGANAIASTMTSTGANAVANTITRASAVSSGGLGSVVKSGTSGTFSTSSTSYVGITNLQAIVQTSGKPVSVLLAPDQSSNLALLFLSSSGSAQILIQNTTLNTIIGSFQVSSPTTGFGYAANFSFVDLGVVGAPGTYTYQAYAKTASGPTVLVNYCSLFVYELH